MDIFPTIVRVGLCTQVKGTDKQWEMGYSPRGKPSQNQNKKELPSLVRKELPSHRD